MTFGHDHDPCDGCFETGAHAIALSGEVDALLARIAELEALLSGWHWQYHGRGETPPEACPNHLCQGWRALGMTSEATP